MTLGERIKQARKNKGFTQKTLGDLVGVVTGTIQQYELGKRQPRDEQLQRIASVLDVSVGYLQGYEKERIIIPGRLKIITVNDPESEYMQYRIEAEDEEAYKQGLQIIESAGVSVQAHTPQALVLAAMDKLNYNGQQKVVERAEELAEIPRYQATALPQSPPAPPEGKDTAQKKKPPEDP